MDKEIILVFTDSAYDLKPIAKLEELGYTVIRFSADCKLETLGVVNG